LAAAKTEKTAAPAPARGRAVSAPKVKKQGAAKVKEGKGSEESSCENYREETRCTG
jgi:hypothetical protein